MNGGCCGGGEKKVSKDALAVAGAILTGCLVIAAAMFVASPKVSQVVDSGAGAQKAGQPNKPEVTFDMIKGLFGDKHISFGDKDRKVLFVEFSDPSCPACHIAGGKNKEYMKKAGPGYVAPIPEMKKLVDAGKASFVWVYLNGHGNGDLAAESLYCAQETGKFWEVHDLLMSDAGYKLLNETVGSDRSNSGILADFLKSAVKPADMKACLESSKYADHLAQDIAVAQQFGVAGTPSLFVNAKNFHGAYSFKDMQATVDQYLK